MDNDEIVIGTEEDTSDFGILISNFQNLLTRQVTGKPFEESEVEVHPDDSEEEEFDNNRTDYVMELLEKIFGIDEDIDPDDVEMMFKGEHLINELNSILEVFTKIISDLVGIKLDLGREMIFFSDFYAVYITFIFDLEKTLIDGFLAYIMENRDDLKDADIEKEFIGYYTDEGFAPMDMIEKLSDIDPGNSYYEQIDEYLATELIFIDWEIFNVYISDYIESNRLSTDLFRKIKNAM